MTHRSAQIALKNLLKMAQGNLEASNGRVGACGKLLEQWRWETERADKPNAETAGTTRYARMSSAELAAEQARLEGHIAMYEEETKQ